MKILCLCEQSPLTSGLIASLEQNYEVPLVLTPHYREVNSSIASKAKKLTIRKIGNYLYFRLLRTLFKRDRLHELFVGGSSETTPTIQAEQIHINSDEINSQKTVELIRKVEPDYLFVCGAPLLKKEIFDIPRFGTVNLHFGISPDYRGHHTLLFPYLEEDYQKLGATLHFIDAGVDTGEILAQIYPEVRGNDCLEGVESKIITLAQEILSGVFEETPIPRKQRIPSENKGRMIHFHDYGLVADFCCAIRYWKNRLFAPEKILSKERIVHFSEKIIPISGYKDRTPLETVQR